MKVCWRTNLKVRLKNYLYSYKHYGFWMPMDTLKDKNQLNNMWSQNDAPWKIWK